MFRPRFIALLLALVTLVVYLPVVRNGFVNFDDDDYVTNNPVVQNGLTWAGVKWAFTTWHTGNWHPLTWLSHMLDCELFGLNAGAQHGVNVLFHTVNAVLLLWLLFRLTGALWLSAFVAALFAWHPLHVESVAWISERKDVLSTFFELLALLAYARYARKPEVGNRKLKTSGGPFPVSDLRPPTSTYYWLSVVCFAAGLMAKPMVVTLPFVLLLLDYWPLQRISNAPAAPHHLSTLLRLVFEKWPFVLLTAASCVVTFLAQRSEGLVVTFQRFPLDARLGNALLSYTRYLWKTIWPVDLAVIYPLHSLPLFGVLAAAVFLILVTWLAWHARRRWPYLLVGWFWFSGTLVPVIGLVQVGGNAMADRYTYIPLVGIFIAAAFGIKDLVTRFQIGIAVPAAAASLVLGSCVLLTERQLSYWHDSVSLFSHAIRATEDNDMAYYCLGVVFAEQHKLGEALVEYRKAEHLAPKRYDIHRNIGDTLGETGKLNGALAEYREAIRLNPKNPLLYERVGLILTELGSFNEAMNQYAIALQLNPGDSRPYYLMGRTLLTQGREAEAVDKIYKALKLDPDDVQALVLLASLFASDANPQIRNSAKAVSLAERANALTGGGQPAVLNILAMSYAAAGRFQEAQQTEQRAIQLAQAEGSEDTNAMNQCLELFKSGRPYRETFSHAPLQNLPEN